jgi:hypothetical protein
MISCTVAPFLGNTDGKDTKNNTNMEIAKQLRKLAVERGKKNAKKKAKK